MKRPLLRLSELIGEFEKGGELPEVIFIPMSEIEEIFADAAIVDELRFKDGSPRSVLDALNHVGEPYREERAWEPGCTVFGYKVWPIEEKEKYYD